jgi:iron complex transport system permease protein
LLFGLTSRRQDLAYLLLTGVALNALASSTSTVILALFLDRHALAQKSMAWMLGSFDGRGFVQLGWASGPLLLGMLGAWLLHRPLDLLVLGEETAATLIWLARCSGSPVMRTRDCCRRACWSVRL